MIKFKESIKKITKLKRYNKANDILAKIISLTFFSTVSENILHNKDVKQPEKEIVILINKTIDLFNNIRLLSNFQKNNSLALTKNISLLKKHKLLWQDIWPLYENILEFQELVNFRNKRFKFNNIQNLYKNKRIAEFGCGNGSITMGCIQDGAKFSYASDIGKKNIQFAKKISKKLKIDKKIKFEVNDILKMKDGKNNFDFLICSAVLHHLKNYNDFNKAIKKISTYANKGAYFFIYVAGKGGMRDSIQKSCVENFHNVSNLYIRKILIDLNFTRNKITHLVDWFKADYMECTPTKLINILKKNKFSIIKRLKGPHKTDMDINQMKEHKFSALKFGTGELRYLFQYVG
jgi:2-polyprenyl-3-methyl-5-hydroxy-6-metoxy-1,4-benzoquinol methylase